MAKNPQLDGFSIYFDRNKDFELTSSEYEDIAGTSLPKDEWYLKKKSAIAKAAREKGYTLEIVEVKLLFKKVI